MKKFKINSSLIYSVGSLILAISSYLVFDTIIRTMMNNDSIGRGIDQFIFVATDYRWSTASFDIVALGTIVVPLVFLLLSCIFGIKVLRLKEITYISKWVAAISIIISSGIIIIFSAAMIRFAF